MPRLVHSAPKYRLHRASGQAMVTILGKDHYLGPWRSKASRLEYDRLVSEWLANGRSAVTKPDASPSVTEVVAAYWQFAKAYYQKNGKLTGSVPGIKVCLRLLRQKYGDTAAADFGPSALRALQQHMVELGQSRRYVNDNIDRIRRVFKWAAAQEFVPVSVHQTLLTVPGLRKGRTEARELPPIESIADVTVDATIPFLPPIVADAQSSVVFELRPDRSWHLIPDAIQAIQRPVALGIDPTGILYVLNDDRRTVLRLHRQAEATVLLDATELPSPLIDLAGGLSTSLLSSLMVSARRRAV